MHQQHQQSLSVRIVQDENGRGLTILYHQNMNQADNDGCVYGR